MSARVDGKPRQRSRKPAARIARCFVSRLNWAHRTMSRATSCGVFGGNFLAHAIEVDWVVVVA